MLGMAKRLKARFLISSTSEVYGDPEIHPQVEEYWGNVNPIGIRSCYDEGKRIAETLCFEYYRQHGVQIRVARIFKSAAHPCNCIPASSHPASISACSRSPPLLRVHSTYGPRMLENDGRVVSNFIVQALKGVPITIYGSGEQTRSFCYVDDLVTGLISLMHGDYIGPVNLGNPGEYTIKQLAEAVQRQINPKNAVVYKEIPSDDPKRRQPDISKAKKHLQWEPKIPLEEGLTKTIADFRARHEAGDF